MNISPSGWWETKFERYSDPEVLSAKFKQFPNKMTLRIIQIIKILGEKTVSPAQDILKASFPYNLTLDQKKQFFTALHETKIFSLKNFMIPEGAPLMNCFKFQSEMMDEEGALALIQTGCPISIKDIETVLSLQLPTVLKALLEREKEKFKKIDNKVLSESLAVACKNGREDIAILLINEFPDLVKNASAFIPEAFEKKLFEFLALIAEKDANLHVDLNGNTFLHAAAKAGHKNLVLWLLGNSANINAKNGSQQTPLFSAFHAKHTPIIKILMAHNAGATGQDLHHTTLLHLTLANPELKEMLPGAFEHMVQHKNIALNAQSSDYKGMTSLMIACEKAKEDYALQLIELGADLTLKDVGGRTALHYAVQNGLEIVVQQILGKTKGLQNTVPYIDEAMHNTKSTALMLACKTGQKKMALDLIHAGADLNLKDESGRTALHYAVQSGLEIVVQQILGKTKGLQNTVPYIDEAINYSKSTALMLACKTGQEKMALELIHAGADLNLKDFEGRQALHCAVLRGLESVVQKIIEIQKNVPQGSLDEPDDAHFTPLMLACSINNKTIAMQLLNAGAEALIGGGLKPVTDIDDSEDEEYEIELIEKDGYLFQKIEFPTPLHLAAFHGMEEIVEVIIKKINTIENKYEKLRLINLVWCRSSTDTYGTPLMCACESGNEKIAHLFIEMGANLRLETMCNQETALHIAVKKGLRSVVKSIITKLNEKQKNDLLNQHATDGEGRLLNYAYAYRHTSQDDDFKQLLDGIISDLISYGADPLAIIQGENVFHRLLRNYYFEEAKNLLQYIDEEKISSVLNTPTPWETPLEIALGVGSYDEKVSAAEEEFILQLIQEGMDCFVLSRKGESVLEVASKLGLKKVVDHIIGIYAANSQDLLLKPQLSDDWIHVLRACELNDEEFNKALFKAGIDILLASTKDSPVIFSSTTQGASALHLACRYGEIEIVQELLLRAEKENKLATWINAKRENGAATPLQYAFCNKHYDLTLLLIEKGADLGPLFTPSLAAVLKEITEQSLLNSIFAHMMVYLEKNPTILDPTLNLGLFFNSKTGSKHSLKVGSEGISSEIFAIHPAILSVRSPYFEKMFSLKLKEGNQSEILIHDNPENFKLLLHFFYAGSIEITHENFKILAHYADRYVAQDLNQKLKEWLIQHPECSNWTDYVDHYSDVVYKKNQDVSENPSKRAKTKK